MSRASTGGKDWQKHSDVDVLKRLSSKFDIDEDPSSYFIEDGKVLRLYYHVAIEDVLIEVGRVQGNLIFADLHESTMHGLTILYE